MASLETSRFIRGFGLTREVKHLVRTETVCPGRETAQGTRKRNPYKVEECELTRRRAPVVMSPTSYDELLNVTAGMGLASDFSLGENP